MKITFTDISWSDYLWLQENDKKLLKRVNLLVKDIIRNPFDGMVNLNRSKPIYQDIGQDGLTLNIV